MRESVVPDLVTRSSHRARKQFLRCKRSQRKLSWLAEHERSLHAATAAGQRACPRAMCHADAMQQPHTLTQRRDY